MTDKNKKQLHTVYEKQNELLRFCVEAKKMKQDNVFKRCRKTYIKIWQMSRTLILQPLSAEKVKTVNFTKITSKLAPKNKKEATDILKNFENSLKKMTDDEFIKYAKLQIKKDK